MGMKKTTTSRTLGLGHSKTPNVAFDGSSAGKIHRSANMPAGNRSGKTPRPKGSVATPLGTKFSRNTFKKK